MGIRVILPSHLQRFTGGLDALEVNGRSTGECIDELIKRFPGLKKVLFYEHGELYDYIGICINREFFAAWERPLNMPVHDGDELMIILMVPAGG